MTIQCLFTLQKSSLKWSDKFAFEDECGIRAYGRERERQGEVKSRKITQFINKINLDEMKANQMKGNIIYYRAIS